MSTYPSYRQASYVQNPTTTYVNEPATRTYVSQAGSQYQASPVRTYVSQADRITTPTKYVSYANEPTTTTTYVRDPAPVTTTTSYVTPGNISLFFFFCCLFLRCRSFKILFRKNGIFASSE